MDIKPAGLRQGEVSKRKGETDAKKIVNRHVSRTLGICCLRKVVLGFCIMRDLLNIYKRV